MQRPTKTLKCLSRFKMSSYIKDWVSFETCAFVDLGVQEYCFRVGHFSRKFDRRVMIVRLFNELFYFLCLLCRARICRLY